MCDCFSAALRTSTALNELEGDEGRTSFNDRIKAAREGIAVCKRYAACSICRDPAQFSLYVIIAQQAVRCLRRGDPSTQSSRHSTDDDGKGEVVKVVIGGFDAQVTVTPQLEAALTRVELQQLETFLPTLLRLFCAQGTKASAVGASEAAFAYQRQLVQSLVSEVHHAQDECNG